MNSIIFINNLHYDIAHSTQLLTEQIEKIKICQCIFLCILFLSCIAKKTVLYKDGVYKQ